MATLGSQPSFTGWWEYGSNTHSQVCTPIYTMPADGYVSSIVIYADAYSGTTEFQGIVWGSSGNILFGSATAYLGAGSPSTGGQAWQALAVSGVRLAAGTQIYIGWWRTSTGTMLFSYGSGTGYLDGNVAGPSSLSGLTAIGAIGAYINYAPVSAPSATTGTATSITATSAVLNGTVNDNGLYTASGGTATSNCDFNCGGTPVGASPSSFTGSVSPTGTVTGLTPNTTYTFQIAAWNIEGTTYGSWVGFTTLALPPSATTGSASSITGTTATLNGTVSDNGLAADGGGTSTYDFRWATNAGLSPCTTTTATGFSGTTGESWPLTGLTPSTTYYFQIVASNSQGTVYGTVQSFTTPSVYSAPYAPTLVSPSNASYHDVSSGETFTAVYNSTDGLNQNAYAFRIKVSGATSYSYYNAGTGALQSTVVWNADSAIPGATFTAALSSTLISDGHTYNWSFASQEGGANLRGPFASDFTLVAQAGPALVVYSPTGTSSATEPLIAWTATPASGSYITAWEAKVFTAAQVAAGGFNPATSTSVWDSGRTSGSASLVQVGTALTPGTYYFYVQVAETGSLTSSWVYSTATVVADLPATPSLSVSWDPVNARAIVVVQGADNILSAVDASFETGVGTATATNAAVAQSATRALDGGNSLLVTPSAAGAVVVSLGPYPVQPSTQYTAFFSDWAGLASENVTAQIAWYAAGPTLISTSAGTAVADSAVAWTQATVTATSPSNAATAYVQFTYTASGTTDTKYLDKCGLYLGSTTAWSAGGFVGQQVATVLYSDNGGTTWQPFVRNGSALSLSSTLQHATVSDYEGPPGGERFYVAVITAGGLASLWSASEGVTATLSSWWAKDPLNPGANIPLIVSDDHQTAQLEQSTVSYPLGTGQIFPVVQAGAIGGEDGSVPVTFTTQAAYLACKALVNAQHVLLLQSPYGEQWYSRLAISTSAMSVTQKSTTLSASSGADPFRSVTLSYVEVGLVAVAITG